MASETEWRRRWKPTLAACPWQNIDVDGENLLMKMKFSQKSYEVLITDLTSFWYESLEEEALKKRIERLNPSIEAPVVKILDQIKQNVDKPGKGTVLSVKFKATRDGVKGGGVKDGDTPQQMVVSITSKLAGMRFVWEFHASPADTDMARDHLTIPLLAMVSELFRRQRELVTVLASKDKEIDDYKAQGVKTSRKHLETSRFDSIAFKNSMVTSKGFEQQVKNLESSTFDGDGQELYRQIVTKHAWITRRDSGDVGEEDMSDEESVPMSSAQVTTSAKQSWTNRLPPSLLATRDASPSKTPTTSPSKSPTKSPAKSPGSHSSSSEATPTKDTEKLRREALERKLEQDEMKKQDKKKKKKLAF